MRKLLNIILLLSMLLPLQLAADQSEADQIEVLLEEALFRIEGAKSFQEKLEHLTDFEANLLSLDEAAQESEYYDYVQLTEALAVADISNLSEIDCPDVLARIHYGWDPTSEVPRFSGIVELVFSIVQQTCLND
ncbi:hypothetical protein ACMXYV_10225 [Neptuniibacter sp. SY11_33]|uniref:hypothetical protein n=1 Tax=Neptuniibacter sp. SY11_33 TaxID=3398215 RepID=UPI0039F5AAD7